MNRTGSTVYTSASASAVIQWAINNAPAGQSVYIAAGTYSLTSTVKVDRTIFGSGTGTKLVASASVSNSLLVLQSRSGGAAHVSNVNISSMELDGKGSTYPTGGYGGIWTFLADHCNMENLYIHDFPKSHGIEFQASFHNTIRSCKIANIGFGNQYGSSICSGNAIDGQPSLGKITSSFNVVDNCILTGASMTGVDWEPGSNNIVRNTVISGLTSWTSYEKKPSGEVGITVGLSIFNPSGWTNSDNNTFYNVTVISPKEAFTTGSGADNVVISGCNFTSGTGNTAVYTPGGSNWIVKDSNIFIRGSGAGVYFYGGRNNTVRNCIIRDASMAKTGKGVYYRNINLQSCDLEQDLLHAVRSPAGCQCGLY